MHNDGGGELGLWVMQLTALSNALAFGGSDTSPGEFHRHDHAHARAYLWSMTGRASYLPKPIGAFRASSWPAT